MNIEVTRKDLANLVMGLSPKKHMRKDVDVSRTGYWSRPAFGGGGYRWYWNDDIDRKFSKEKLHRIWLVLKGVEPVVLKDGTKITDSEAPPLFIALGSPDSSTKMRLTSNDEYWIDNGCWSIEYEYKEGVFYAVHSMEHINGKVLYPVSESQYKKSAGKYYQHGDFYDYSEKEDELPY